MSWPPMRAKRLNKVESLPAASLTTSRVGGSLELYGFDIETKAPVVLSFKSFEHSLN